MKEPTIITPINTPYLELIGLATKPGAALEEEVEVEEELELETLLSLVLVDVTLPLETLPEELLVAVTLDALTAPFVTKLMEEVVDELIVLIAMCTVFLVTNCVYCFYNSKNL